MRGSPARHLTPEAALAALGIPLEGPLPAPVPCPSCHRRRLVASRDDVLGGGWYACPCGLAGDSIELAGVAWGLTPHAAYRKLVVSGLLQVPDADAGAARHVDHLGVRAAAAGFWAGCRDAPSSHDTADLADPLRRLGLMDAARSSGWAGGIGRFVGLSDHATVNSTFRPHSDGHKLFPGSGWGRVLVVPFRDQPGRIRTFLFVGRDGDRAAGDWAVYRVPTGSSVPLSGAEGGLAFFDAIGGPGPSVVAPDVELVLRLQARHLLDAPDPLPLAASWEEPDLKTRAAFDAVRRRGPLVLWGHDAPALRQARRAGATVAPSRPEPDARVGSGAGPGTRRPARAVVAAAAASAVGWESAVEAACRDLGDREAEELILDLGMTPDELRRFVASSPEALRARLAGLAPAGDGRRTVFAGARTVAEDKGCWWIVRHRRPDELLTDAVVRVDRVLRTASRTVHEGRVLFGGREVPFRAAGKAFARDPLAYARDLLLAEGVGVATVASGWGRHALAIAQQLHPPAAASGYGRVGWDRGRGAFVFPHAFLEPGGSVTPHGDFDVDGPTPCAGLAVDEGPTEVDLSRLARDPEAGRVALAVAAFVVADALAARLGRPRTRLALVGDGAARAGRAAALACGVLEAARAGVSKLLDGHHWPALLNQPAPSAWVPGLAGGAIAPMNHWFAAAACAGGGWQAVRLDARGVPDVDGVSRVAAAHLRDLASRRFPDPGPDLLDHVLADQRSWLATLGATLPAASDAFGPREPGDHLVRLLSMLVDAGTLDDSGLRGGTGGGIAALGMGRLGVDPDAVNSALALHRAGPLDVPRATALLRQAGALLAGEPGYAWVLAGSWWRPRLQRQRAASAPRPAADRP